MTYHDRRAFDRRAFERRAYPADRFDAGPFDVEFHVAGCDCPHCVDDDTVPPRLTWDALAGYGLLGLAFGVSVALMLAFAGHPDATIAAVAALLGFGL